MMGNKAFCLLNKICQNRVYAMLIAHLGRTAIRQMLKMHPFRKEAFNLACKKLLFPIFEQRAVLYMSPGISQVKRQ